MADQQHATSDAPSAAGRLHAAPPLRVERRFQTAPERLFHAWTTAEALNQWASPDAAPAATEVDLRVGRRYRISMTAPDGTVRHVSGVYREIDPPRRLVYTWRWEQIPNFPETVVTVEFRARADGGTDLVLLHEGLPEGELARRHESGWNGSLAKLGALVGKPAPR